MRIALASALWTVVAGLSLALSVAFHLGTPLARRAARITVSRFVTSQIRGALQIGRIDVLTFHRVVARHVILRDASGRRVAVADEVVLMPDVRAALHGTLRFAKARLHGGAIALVPGADGSLPTLIEALGAAHPSSSNAPGLHAIVDDIRLDDVMLHGSLLGLDGLRAEHVRAHGRLEASRYLEIRLFSARGDVVRPFPFVGHVDRLVASISTNPTRGLHLWARTHRGMEHADANVVFAVPAAGRPTDPQELDLYVHGDPVSAQSLVDLHYDWARYLRGEVRGWFHVHGPPDDLRFAATLATDGGPALVQGHVPSEGPVDIAVRTTGVDLDRVVRLAPLIHIAGSAAMHITPAPEGAAPGTPPTVDLSLEPFLWDRWAVPALTIHGRLDDDAFLVDRVEAPYAGGAVKGSGRVGFDGHVALDLAGHIPQIARDPNIRRTMPGAHGAVAGAVHVELGGGLGDRLVLAGHVTARSLRYGPFVAEALRAQGSVQGNPTHPATDLHVTGSGWSVGSYPLGTADFRLRGGPRHYVATGRFTAEGGRRAAFDATVDAEAGRYAITAHRIEDSLWATWCGAEPWIA